MQSLLHGGSTNVHEVGDSRLPSIYDSQLYRDLVSTMFLKRRQGRGNVMVTTASPIPGTLKPLGKAQRESWQARNTSAGCWQKSHGCSRNQSLPSSCFSLALLRCQC